MTVNIKNNVKGQTLLRQRNISLVVRKINFDGPITKREIVNQTGISFAKVNSITSQLNNLGVTLETGKEESNGGRRSSLFELSPNFRFTIGCQMSHTRIHTAVISLKGEILFEDFKPFNKSDGSEAVINLLLESIENILIKSQIPKEKYLGIGISIAGLFNPKDETSFPFPHLVEWGNVEIKSIVMEKFNLPCYVNNVANMAALAELNFGLGKGKESVLFLNVGAGLGMGIIFNGKLYEGISGTAGEFGHISVDDNGPVCKCGNVGCLEVLASTIAVVNQAKTLINNGVASVISTMVNDDLDKLNFPIICEAAIQGDKLAYNLIDKMGVNLGEGIVTLINLLNPEQIIVGGKIVSAGEQILNSIMNIVQKRALEIPRKNTEIIISKMGSTSGTIGSTIPIIEKFFENELIKLIE